MQGNVNSEYKENKKIETEFKERHSSLSLAYTPPMIISRWDRALKKRLSGAFQCPDSLRPGQ